jgi:hypothetical protein
VSARPTALELVALANPLPADSRVDTLVPTEWRDALLARVIAEPAFPGGDGWRHDARGTCEDRTLLARRPRTGVVIAVSVLALALAGVAIGVGLDLVTQQERFHETAPDHPQRSSPLVEIVSGDEWALIAWNSDAGICLDFAIAGNSPFSCGFPVRGAKPADDASGAGLPVHAVAGSISSGGLVGGDGKATIFGVAALEVAKVEVELQDGRVTEAPLYDAPPELGADVRIFLVRLVVQRQQLGGLSPVRAFVAYDSGGQLIERFSD